MTCSQCALWGYLSPNLYPDGLFGKYPLPTNNTGLCSYELELGIMLTRPKWIQGDCHFANNCPRFVQKGTKR